MPTIIALQNVLKNDNIRKHKTPKGATLLFVRDIENEYGSKAADRLKNYAMKERIALNGNSQMRSVIVRADLELAIREDKFLNDLFKGAKSVEPAKPTTAPKAVKKTTMKDVVAGLDKKAKSKEKLKAKSKTTNVSPSELVSKLRSLDQINLDVVKGRIAELCKNYSLLEIRQRSMTEADIQAEERMVYRKPYRAIYKEFERLNAGNPQVEAIKKKKHKDDSNYIDLINEIGMIDQVLAIATYLFAHLARRNDDEASTPTPSMAAASSAPTIYAGGSDYDQDSDLDDDEDYRD